MRQTTLPIRILIVDDHLIIREGLRLVLASMSDSTVVGEATDGISALRLAGELLPDVVLMDIRMPGMDGLETLEHILKRWQQIAVIILTTYDDDELMLHGLKRGATGYLLKNTDRETLYHAIRSAAQGKTLVPTEIMTRLLAHTTSTISQSPGHNPSATKQANQSVTERERQVLQCVARGQRNKEIALHLGISEPTVKSHLASIYYKLNVDSRASAVAVAIERGLLSIIQRGQAT